MTRRETAAEIEAAAAAWVLRLDGAVDAPDRRRTLEAKLETWLEADPRRQGAFLQAQAAWALLDRASALAPQGVPAVEDRPSPSRRWLVAGAGGALAASAAGLLAVGLQRERYGTGVGEIRRVPLKDGSTAAINTQSVVEVDLQPNVRRVRLRRGEAWFQVAKNRERPFIVEAGRVRVRAVGTAFSVRRRADGADVLVTEGVVEAWADGAEGHRVRIAAGQKAYVADNAAIAESQAGPSEIDRELAWRAGKIDLAGVTLGEAAAEFNRYNSRKLVIADPTLAGQRLYGVFRTDDPEGFARAVHQSLGAAVATDGDGAIRLGATSG
jgi:transmembrane sensor